ncbi:MAG: response regulator transcription factor [Eubacterium sp.]|nr:response regulator transcription factor [Eubacterium sp.]
MKILIAEDDSILAEEIRQFLVRWGYEAAVAVQFENLASECLALQPHLLLLDINLPFYDGFYWCSKIREQSQVPVIFISSRSDDMDKIMAVAQGGDDYVEKPFRLELLKAKIQAMLRRTYQYQTRVQAYLREELYFDYGRCTLVYQNKPLDLTKSEQRILSKLAEKMPEVVTRQELMMELWSTDEFVSDGTLTTMVSRLRSKLKSFCGEELVMTKKGQGYLLL